MAKINFSFKEHFHLSPNEQKGYLTFLFLLIIIAFVKGLIIQESRAPVINQNFRDLADSAKAKSPENQLITQNSKELFDPNTASENILFEHGLSKKTAQRIIRFRKAGGRFFKKNDLLKIYGIDSSIVEQNLPFIKIETKHKPRKKSHAKNQNHYSIININLADSSELIKVKGIGPILSSRIVKYRNMLGGFHSTNQLLEVYGFRDSSFQNVKKQVNCSGPIKKIRINHCSFKELVKHPYCTYEMCKIIFNSKKGKTGAYSKESLTSLHGIKKNKMQKLLPYLSFD